MSTGNFNHFIYNKEAKKYILRKESIFKNGAVYMLKNEIEYRSVAV